MDNQEDYRSLAHEDWCDLLLTIEAKDNMKRAKAQIINIASARSTSYPDSEKSVRVPRKKKSRTGVLRNKPNKKAPKHHSTHRHCVICKKDE